MPAIPRDGGVNINTHTQYIAISQSPRQPPDELHIRKVMNANAALDSSLHLSARCSSLGTQTGDKLGMHAAMGHHAHAAKKNSKA